MSYWLLPTVRFMQQRQLDETELSEAKINDSYAPFAKVSSGTPKTASKGFICRW
ncbi:hypothetical protein SBC2_76210 (plasmid) [Caballeronia sp. SBC2]|nr:hypothetical protein SBC2_76210 [Caballeronia sp. SBC2]